MKGMSKRTAEKVLLAYNQVLSLSDEWLECFWCEDCQVSTWWHVKRLGPLEYTLETVAKELWEQASGVIRPEGNPSVSQFTRRNARFGGIQGLRQFRYL